MRKLFVGIVALVLVMSFAGIASAQGTATGYVVHGIPG